ncbi:MAG: hypothetical protein ACRC62_18415 [Microcoleus sp.]
MQRLKSKLSAYNARSVQGGIALSVGDTQVSIGYYNQSAETFQLLIRSMEDGQESLTAEENLTEAQVLEYIETLALDSFAAPVRPELV